MKSEFEKKCDNGRNYRRSKDDNITRKFYDAIEEYMAIHYLYCFTAIHDFILSNLSDIIDMLGGSEFLAEELKKREDVTITYNKPS